jgi:hypothetical protein
MQFPTIFVLISLAIGATAMPGSSTSDMLRVINQRVAVAKAEPRGCAIHLKTGELVNVASLTAIPSGYKLQHCAPCGKCSNARDADILRKTADNYSSFLDKCGHKYANPLGGKSSAIKCIKEKFDFSDGCADCSLQSVKCVYDNCKMACMAGMGSNKVEDSSCLRCAEYSCGEEVERCSGATRGRLGIQSNDMPAHEVVCAALKK